MKLSQVEVNDIKEYLRIDSDVDDMFIESLIGIGKAYVCSYTGLTIEKVDAHPELAIALMALCGEFYENRQVTVQTGKVTNVNPIIKSILDMHCINLL